MTSLPFVALGYSYAEPGGAPVTTNEIMRAAMDRAWGHEGHVTRVIVDGRERSRDVKTRRRG